MTSNPPSTAAPRPGDALTVAQALARVLDGARTLQPEHVPLLLASGRTLAHDLAAALTNPPFDASSMDGYAVRSADLATIPATLKLTGESAAGWPFAGSVKPGEAVRIFTGAPLPDGADTVVIQEDATAGDGTVVIKEAAKHGANVRTRGHDFREGDAVLRAGTRLAPRHILLAASAGHALLAVARKPVVAILATGDELVEPSDLPRAAQIVSSNTYGLAAMVEAAGGTPKVLGIARDTAEDLAQKFAEAEGADVLVTMGGASVGDHDLVRPTLEAQGATLDFYKIAMRPGKPVFCGTMNGTRVLGLPGNPLSVMIGARVFLVPLIAKLLGRSSELVMSKARLAAPIGANGPRAHYMRACLDDAVSPPAVRALDSQDSAFVKALTDANCLVVQPANSPALPAGTEVDIVRVDF
jgi:molybdopterin molybdotransferase